MPRYEFHGVEGYVAIRPPDPSWVPLFRLHHPGALEDHFFTTSPREREIATSFGYVYEGIAGHVCRVRAAGLDGLHRLFHAGVRNHFYTRSEEERDHVVRALGYAYEGVAGWVAREPRPGFAGLHRGYQPTTLNHLYTGHLQELFEPALRHQAPPEPISDAGHDSFCILPWKHLEVRREGHVDFCCKYRYPLTSACGTPLSVQTHSLDEIWNSDDMRAVRRAMVEGRRLKGCELCYEREANGFPSDRVRVLEEWRQGWLNPERTSVAEWKEQAVRDDFRHAAPEYLELRTGHLCNLKCRICFGDTSSRIAADPAHSRWFPGRSYRGVERWWADPAVLRSLLAGADRLRQLYLLGGEPMLVDELGDVLRHVIERGVARDVELEVVTNGTTTRATWLPLVEAFQKLRLHVSIDAFGPLNRYIRHPAVWETLVESVAFFQRLPKASVAAATVLQAYNALDVVDLFRFCDEAGLRIGYVYPIDHPRWLRTDVVPPAGRRLAAQRLRAYAADDCRPENRALMRSLASGLESFGDALDEDALREFLRFTHALDAGRDRTFEEACPELWKLIEETGIPAREATASQRS